MWMETPNGYDSKGYGKGLISVDTVSISDFNANPDAYLKNADGSYKYDVLYFGAWDNNNCRTCRQRRKPSTDAFIKTGRGVLFGHDTMVDNDANFHAEFFQARPLLQYSDDPNHYTTLGGSQIKVTKKGLLTNYPWKIGDVGTVLNVPMSHSNSACIRGRLDDISAALSVLRQRAAKRFQRTRAPIHFYLTSW